MRGIKLVIGLFTVGATLSSVQGCARTNEAGGELAPSEVSSVSIHNENFLDMDIYVVSQGLSNRLGTVTGNTTRRFVLDRGVTSQDFAIIASPIGGGGRASTGSITVSPGETVDFRIGSVLSNSSVVIR